MALRSELLRALGVIALLMPAAIADGKAENLVALASAPAAQQEQAVGSHDRALPVFFEPNSAVLPAAARRVLSILATRLAAAPGLQLTVNGYAETEEAGHAGLAAERVLAVRAFLIAQGVADERLVDAPAMKEDTPLVRVLADSPLERRTEISLQ